MDKAVSFSRRSVVLPSYLPHDPDRNPMFFEKRVYQGSSGRVYPLPYYNRISETPVPHSWDAIFIENEFVEVMLLPELGGRIHRAKDKINGYDFIYYQPVIKPALVGLGGPWASGGIEFNWPQHHRPSTFMPVDVQEETSPDGSVTVWLSEHDPMTRMKGMHGVCLRPGVAAMELRARAYNRTNDVQTFLWWANAAVQVHEDYQSFFPPDVSVVADHARRAMSTFPFSKGTYYGIDYGSRRASKKEKQREFPRAPNDLSWYANIPVPTSYMCIGSDGDFVGGYDFRKQGGVVHVANHHVSPGKKQWTWGNHEFGYSWDKNLTDAGPTGEFPPYIELMAGVYTDNQPDFSFLQPGETKAWTQWWFPIRSIGPVQAANQHGALSLTDSANGFRLGIVVTEANPDARVVITSGKREVANLRLDLTPAVPLVKEFKLSTSLRESAVTVVVISNSGREILKLAPAKKKTGAPVEAAVEPALPALVQTADELFLIGLHLEQYRHATRLPEPYWREALRRDPGDARCNLALGRYHMRRGEFESAEIHLRASITRITSRNANPYDGEAYYQLGLCLRHLGRDDEAYDAFYKSTWNHAWQAAGYFALSEIDCSRGDWNTALDHLNRALNANGENLNARALKVVALRRLNRPKEAAALLDETLAIDRLDWWARYLKKVKLDCNTQVRFDLALDCARAGLLDEALEVLSGASPEPFSGTAPLLHYYRAWIHGKRGDLKTQRFELEQAERAPSDYCFPARLEEIEILQTACEANLKGANAPFYLGNLLYDRRRHQEGIARWERAVRNDGSNAVALRNLGIGYYNISHSPAKARAAYEQARRANPVDPRILYERDQLWKRLGVKSERRLAELEAHPDLVAARDDLSVEICALYNQVGRPEMALPILAGRRFQPWEGGEGLALAQHIRTHMRLGCAALVASDPAQARSQFTAALEAPANLGEADHPLANKSARLFWIAEACAAEGDLNAATHYRKEAVKFRGDFQDMSVKAFSEMTYYTALSWMKLGQKTRAQSLLRKLLSYSISLGKSRAKVDYFATSLPSMLLFDEDLQFRQRMTAAFLNAQAQFGLGRHAAAKSVLKKLLTQDPSNPLAADFLAEMRVTKT